MKQFFSMAMIAVLLATSACGDTPGQRAVSGGAIGAGVGAVGSAIVGGPILGAALVGGAVGAGTGALTDKSQINLGN